MDAVLTGKAGSDALRAYARFGSAGASFDGRKVALAVRSGAGRARLLGAGISTRIRNSVRTAARPRSSRVRRSSESGSTRRAAPGRAEPHPGPSAALSASLSEAWDG